MNQLAHLQQQFFTQILYSDNHADDLILSDNKLNATQRLNIYSEAYLIRLLDALSDTYPALHTLLGDEDFEKLGISYIKSFPSENYSLRYFGNKLSSFIKQHELYSQTQILSEMAEFEWRLRFAFDAADASPLTRQDLTAIEASQWPKLIFKIIPSFTSIILDWSTAEIWKAIEQQYAPVTPYQNQSSVHWIIWRPQLITKFRSIETLERQALQKITEGNNFSELCEFIAMHAGADSDILAAQYLGKWIDEGLFASTSVDTDEQI